MVRGPLPALLLTLPVLLAASAVQEPPSREEAVNAAIERGVAFLLSTQNRDGSWGVDIEERTSTIHDLRDGSCALAVYTLLKCGLAGGHPAIQRALAFLLENTPTRTYATGVQLHALGALHDPAQKKRMQELLAILLDLLANGGWDYPGAGRPDLSNTQVAALGLRAAHAAGLSVPKATWGELVGLTLRYQERPVEIPGTALLPREKRRMAGFSYEPEGKATASMTTAGLTILGIATEDPLRVDHRFDVQIEEARALALNWLEQHYSVEGNPEGDGSWHCYYLYGLERVGALNGITKIGAHDWYLDGAAQLLKEQRDDGGWRNDDDPPWPWPLMTANTSFALLFLRKATLPVITGQRREPLYRLEGPDSDVWLVVDGKQSWTMWITGFAPVVAGRFGGDKSASGVPANVRVQAVEWWIDGELAGKVAGDPARPWKDDRYPLKFQPKKGGTLEVECRVSALDPSGAPCELRSKPLGVRSDLVLEPWMLEYARDAASSAFRGQEFTITVSSEESQFHPKGDLFDGLQGSSWWAKQDDQEPWIRVESVKGLHLKELWLSPAASNERWRKDCAVFDEVELRINDAKVPLVVRMESDWRLKTKVALGKPMLVRKLELRVRHTPEPGKYVGFAEIEGR
ncbi:MAG: hypothetical protein EXS08_09335 [Planctomycetes bacterium]|nr:hypothetical protein [Planctomycetota bacterium]